MKVKEKSVKRSGHGGWVVGADFVAGQDNFIVSASDDATVRHWNPATYWGLLSLRKRVMLAVRIWKLRILEKKSGQLVLHPAGSRS